MIRALSFAAASLAAFSSASTVFAFGGTVVLKAGTIHLVDGGTVLRGNAAVIARDGVIVATGTDLAVPAGAEVVDYGPDAVIVPGLVSAGTSLGMGAPSQRTADPLVRAVDNFDVYSNAYVFDVMGGVTTAYLAPTRLRLIGGQGAVIKLAGEADSRVVSASSSIHGTVTDAARSVQGFWEPPVPATVDVGLGVAEQQLPGSLVGAITALDEITGIARGRMKDSGTYGPQTAGVLRDLMQHGTPWHMEASSPEEIRALLEWARREKLPLVLESSGNAGAVAREIAAAKVPVIVSVDVVGDSSGRDFGKDEDTRWPSYDSAAKLAAAGVELAIAGTGGVRPRDLRFAAQVASRGGLPSDVALRAITLGAAKAIGVDQRVGSLTAGKDADFCVLSGAPLATGSAVIATWVRGEIAWKSPASNSVVVEVDELHIGDGEVLRPGQLAIRAGRIVEVGHRVSHPLGARVVRAAAAMPGMIDALGFLGLEGSQRAPQADFKLARIVEPGDETDRRVAKSGVTTVVLAPRNTSDSGVPLMAYKPAATEFDHQVISDPAALRLRWTDDNRLKSGAKVRELLDKAKDYDKKWRDYEEALKKWVPPAQEPAADEKKSDEKAKDGEKKDEKAGDEKKEESSGDKKDEKKEDKKKKDKKDEEEADPVTGIWTAKVTVPPSDVEAQLRLTLQLTGEHVTGTLRCDSVSSTLVQVAGTWKEKKLALRGLGSRGFVQLSGEPKGGKFEATLTLGKNEAKCNVERTTKELPVAQLPEIRKEKSEEAKEPKGKPRAPGVDDRLEPFRRAMRGEAAIIVNVDSKEEILACVDAFEAVGIKPVLYGASESWIVADKLAGRVAGVLLTQRVLDVPDGKGLNELRNRYAELASAGVPLAFHSLAEEGAAELPMMAAYAVSLGLSPDAAMRGLTSGVASMMGIGKRVGSLAPGLDGDVVLLDGPPLEPSTSVVRTFVNGEEVK